MLRAITEDEARGRTLLAPGWKRISLVALLVLLAALALPSRLLADGDPGSDVLLDQNLFVGSDSGVSIPQQEQVRKLLNLTATAGAPVRVAVISHPDDLGTVTPLWDRPQAYAAYLGTELSLTYRGRLLVVMPSGIGFYWAAKRSTVSKIAGRLTGIVPGSSAPDALVEATRAAVGRIGSAGRAGAVAPVRRPRATRAGPVAGPALEVPASTNRTLLLLALLAIVGSVGLLVAPFATGRAWRAQAGLASAPLVLAAVILVFLSQSGSAQPAAQTGNLATNPNLDPGQTLAPKTAPGFTLTDESGHKVSLSEYRGKVVILSFTDDECQTICPLTTTAMLDAKGALGAAGSQVQLLGVDANWKSTQIEDVLNYTELHGLAGQWHFLTGPLPALEHVWTAYNVNERPLMAAHTNQIDHVPALYVIDPQGRLRMLYTTQPSYSAIPQLGQLLADEASKLLPSHPPVHSNYTYGQVHGISPAETVSIPRAGGGRVTLGPGKPRLYLFFATWDRQTTAIGAHLKALDGYERIARRDGLPRLTAIDEASVEPSAAALPAFLRSLRQPLSYPVGLDQTGRIADGYEVQGEPWFVLTSASGASPWYQAVYTSGWPGLRHLVADVRGALSPTPVAPTSEQAALKELRGSPESLASLHAEAKRLLAGGQAALDRRVHALHGYPVVINVWASWCQPCQQEFGLFANASALFGKRVAFLGADTNDQSADARSFLRVHPVSYPSYRTTDSSIQAILVGGLQGTPTTIFVSPKGAIVHITTGQYRSQGALDQDIQEYALTR